MNRLLALSLAAPLLLSAACTAGTASRAAGTGGTAGGGTLYAVNERGERIVCRRERPTGSNIAEQVCRTEAAIEAERNQTQRELMKARPSQRGGN